MPTRITDVIARDIRFPTSRTLAGSDAMNPDPDYSAAYAILKTDHPNGLEGHGFTFTIGRGNELCVAAIESLSYLIRGQTVEDLAADPAAFWGEAARAIDRRRKCTVEPVIGSIKEVLGFRQFSLRGRDAAAGESVRRPALHFE
jgi:L-alanine-DL-glutamate epimerase-like enolase superfamily enzyme